MTPLLPMAPFCCPITLAAVNSARCCPFSCRSREGGRWTWGRAQGTSLRALRCCSGRGARQWEWSTFQVRRPYIAVEHNSVHTLPCAGYDAFYCIISARKHRARDVSGVPSTCSHAPLCCGDTTFLSYSGRKILTACGGVQSWWSGPRRTCGRAARRGPSWSRGPWSCTRGMAARAGRPTRPTAPSTSGEGHHIAS